MSNIRSSATAIAAITTNSLSISSALQLSKLSLPDTGFLRQSQVLYFIPISKSTLWRRIQAKTFPEPIKLSERVTVWRAEDIRHWIIQQGQPI